MRVADVDKRENGRGHFALRAAAGALATAMLLAGGCDNAGGGTGGNTTANTAAATAQPDAHELGRNRTYLARTKGPNRTIDPPDRIETHGIPVEFSPPVFDFGYLEQEEDAETTVEVINTGDRPLMIDGIKTSCDCTQVRYDSTMIPPGESLPVTATLDGRSSTGPYSVDIFFRFTGHAQPIELKSFSIVSLPLVCSPHTITTRNIRQGIEAQYHGTFTIESIDQIPFTIFSSNGQPPDYVDFDPETDEPRHRYTLRWDLRHLDPEDCEGWPRFWLVDTDHPECPVADLYVRQRCNYPTQRPHERGWRVANDRVSLGYLRYGESREVTFLVNYFLPEGQEASDNAVTELVSLSDDFDVELLGTDYSRELPAITMRVTPREGFTGVLYGLVEVRSALGGKMALAVIAKVVE